MDIKRFLFPLFVLVCLAATVTSSWNTLDASDVLLTVFIVLSCITVSWLIFVGVRKMSPDQVHKHTPIWLSYRRLVAACVAFYLPRSGTCLRCHMPWAVTNPHVTRVEGLFGMRSAPFFAVCELCWRSTDVDLLISYYIMQMARYMNSGALPNYIQDQEGRVVNSDWMLVKEAVLRDKQESQHADRKEPNSEQYHSDGDRRVG